MSRFRGSSLLDVGCLDSLIIPLAWKKYPPSKPFLVGIDTAKDVSTQMSRKYPYALFYNTDLFSFQSESLFDYVVLGEVIEHIENPQLAIMKAMQLLNPGGILALSTPWEETELGEVDKERHIWSFSPQDIRDMLEPYGTVEIQRLGSQWFPRYRYAFPSIIAFGTKK